MKRIKTKKIVAIVSGLLLMLGIGCTGAQAQPTGDTVPIGDLAPLSQAEQARAKTQAQASPFKVRAIFMDLNLFFNPLDDTRQIVQRASERGYNMVVFVLSQNQHAALNVTDVDEITVNGLTDKQMVELVAFSRSVGMEPAFGVNTVGKQGPIFDKLAKKYPDLLVGMTTGDQTKVLNSAMRFADGRDPYEALVFPIFDKIISWYGAQPPKYLFLGIDEIPVNALALAGEKQGLSAAEFFAQDINRCTSYLLKREITPVMYGDMFLSSRLAKPGHGVEGFTADPRFEAGDDNAYNAEYAAGGSGHSVLTAMNHLTNRDKIVIGDWHYWPHVNGEFASVDYFQKMGFRVWGISWFDMEAVRELTRYSAKRHVEGMISAAFPLSWSILPWLRPTMPPMFNNSILYYNNPDFEPAKPEFTSYRIEAADGGIVESGNWGAVISPSAKSVIVEAQIPDSVKAERVQPWLFNGETNEALVGKMLPSKPGHIRAEIDLSGHKQTQVGVYDLFLRYRDGATGYLAQQLHPGVVALSDRKLPVAGADSDAALYEADFSVAPKLEQEERVLLSGGKYGALVLLREKEQGDWRPLANGALDITAIDTAFGYPPQALWDTINEKGMHLVIDATMTSLPEKTTQAYASLISYGDYNYGFRILVGADGQVQFQLAQDRPSRPRVPAIVRSAKALELNQPVKIDVWLTPPDAQGQRTLSMKIGDGQERSVAVEYRLRPPYVGNLRPIPLVFGAEYIRGNTKRKTFQAFPGSIRRVAIMPYTPDR